MTPHLLLEPDEDGGIDRDFLIEAISRFDEDDTVQSSIVEAAEDLSQQLSKMSMNDNYKPYLYVSGKEGLSTRTLIGSQALRNLVQYKPIVNAIEQSPIFLPPSIPAGMIEVTTLLGPFFAISPLQADVTTNYFSSPKTRDRAYISNSQRALRLTLQTHQTELFDIVNHFVKGGEGPKNKMLDWFVLFVNANHAS